MNVHINIKRVYFVEGKGTKRDALEAGLLLVDEEEAGIVNKHFFIVLTVLTSDSVVCRVRMWYFCVLETDLFYFFGRLGTAGGARPVDTPGREGTKLTN